eukprot:6207899-Pleurochrysis_carterae.AAC.1
MLDGPKDGAVHFSWAPRRAAAPPRRAASCVSLVRSHPGALLPPGCLGQNDTADAAPHKPSMRSRSDSYCFPHLRQSSSFLLALQLASLATHPYLSIPLYPLLFDSLSFSCPSRLFSPASSDVTSAVRSVCLIVPCIRQFGIQGGRETRIHA